MMNMDLSEEQIAAIRQLALNFQKETLEIRNQLQLKQLEIKELRMAADLDMEQIKTKLEEIAQLQVEIRMKSFERQDKMKEIITPEQLAEHEFGFSMQKGNPGNIGNRNTGNIGNANPGQGFKGNRW